MYNIYKTIHQRIENDKKIDFDSYAKKHGFFETQELYEVDNRVGYILNIAKSRNQKITIDQAIDISYEINQASEDIIYDISGENEYGTIATLLDRLK